MIHLFQKKSCKQREIELPTFFEIYPLADYIIVYLLLTKEAEHLLNAKKNLSVKKK